VKRITTPARVGAALVLAPAVMVLASGPALAASSVSVSNTETVQAHLNADGTVQDARVYEQIALQGNGTLTIKNPVSTKNLRNLDGFGAFDVQNGNMISTQTVSGEQRLRSVSDFGKVLPLKVAVTYKLDGKTVQAGDVVGKSGRLEVHYKVDNVTGKDQEVTYDDGTGKKVTETQKVVIPMVGSLSTLLPSSFTDVQSAEASMAGDGNGATSMTFTMTLFGPIGASTSEFGYSAAIKDGVIPDATISALPVSPLDNPSFKGGAASYKAGADSGVTLTAGAIEIDANVLKLRDGAQTLLAGLIQLRDGAQTLNAGLADSAAPGAIKLADGASQLKSGAGQLKAGAGNAKAGSTKLAVGAGQVSDGSKQLSAGLIQIRDGVAALPANPSVKGGTDQLKTGLDAIIAGVGSASTANTLLWGVAQMQGGVGQLTAGLDHAATSSTDPGGAKQVLQQLMDQLDNSSLTDPGAKQALTAIIFGLDHAPVPATPTDMGAKQAIAALQSVLGCADNTSGVKADGTPDMIYLGANPTDICKVIAPTISDPSGKGPAALQTKFTLAKLKEGLGDPLVAANTALYGLTQIKTKIGSRDVPGQTALYALDQVVKGIGAASQPTTLLGGLAQVGGGLAQVQAGLSNPGCEPLSVDPAKKCGVLQGASLVRAGIDQLVAGISDSLAGVLNPAAAGAAQVASGAGQLAVGAGQLDTGLGDLANGASLLNNGTVQLSDGASKLAAGLGDAATGSGQLADGLAKAADGGKALPAGASKLSAEGTSKLVESGKTTASDYGLKYAVIVAGAERAKTEAMAYGAPAGATGATAYSLEISGANGNGGSNIGRGVGALALFGAGGGLALFRRRLV
jgi:putative membrane protein